MKLEFPDKLNRKAVRRNFDKLNPETWDYLFDYEKENGLSSCRTQGWGVRHAWYDTALLKVWLIDRGYYTLKDFDSEGWPISVRIEIPRGLTVRTHILT